MSGTPQGSPHKQEGLLLSSREIRPASHTQKGMSLPVSRAPEPLPGRISFREALHLTLLLS